ncbi:unnamed protein product [Zymoseptoria tritici ST99CH_1E4]|uniref:Septin-type G domain-containing protein n=1 Tax=Zymoseptoria tritici ST99CH_1E4 TaxID=1276532 RepID=A0A2H1H8K6_ZYMTR|nr:unnamed protein product [Zymoseptoria tritici ST99CH_1E4]
MATGFNLAERLSDRGDWSSHRPPPPIPPPAVPDLIPSPSHDDFQNIIHQSNTTYPSVTPRSTRSTSISVHPRPPTATDLDADNKLTGRTFSLGRRSRDRGNSFSFSSLRRSSSFRRENLSTADSEPPPPLPPLPNTLISQAHGNAACRKSNEAPVLPSSPFKMLRKVSRQRATPSSPPPPPSEPPHLPTLNKLPDLATFGGEDIRPDSVAIFNNAYTTSNIPQQQPRTTNAANFSRPHAMAPALITSNNSSPPGYIANSSSSPHSNVPARPAANGEYVVDPYEHSRTSSMAHRGRFSFASSNVNSTNSPRRVRRRKDPTPFNVLVVGAKNSGKTSFVNFLRHSLSKTPHQSPERVEDHRGSFTSHYLETEMSGERVGLTLWDSAGLERSVVDLQLREMTTFVESKFEDTFVEEQKVMRSPGVKDTHIHCVLLILDPVNLDSTISKSAVFKKTGDFKGSLDNDLDLQVVQALWGKTTVIPVIGKADTLTTGHMAYLKRAVWSSIKSSNLDPLEALELEDTNESDDGEPEEEDGGNLSTDQSDSDLPTPSKSRRESHKRQPSHPSMVDPTDTPYLPMSILSPDPYDLPPFAPKAKAGSKVGRRFPWGVADPHDAAHCDFGRLRDSVFLEWRSELRDLSRSKWYENWRTTRLNHSSTVVGARKVRGVASMIGNGSARLSGARAGSASLDVARGASAMPRSASGLSAVGEGAAVNGDAGDRKISSGAPASEVGSVRRN